jgi:hypothetical protein
VTGWPATGVPVASTSRAVTDTDASVAGDVVDAVIERDIAGGVFQFKVTDVKVEPENATKSRLPYPVARKLADPVASVCAVTCITPFDSPTVTLGMGKFWASKALTTTVAG